MPPQVLNPGFESDLSNWVKTDADASVTWTRDTATTNAGSAGSSKFVQTVAGADDFINQFVDPSFQGFPGGALVTITAWLNVTSFTAGAISNNGLWVLGRPSTNVLGQDLITAVTGGWVQKRVVMQLDPTDTGIEIRLYAPQATLFWDDVNVSTPTPVFKPNRMPMGV